MKKKVQTKISKWGNGYGIRIPVHLIGELTLSEGTVVGLMTEGDKIVVKPERSFKNIKNMSLDAIYKGFEKEKDVEDYYGGKKGREIW